MDEDQGLTIIPGKEENRRLSLTLPVTNEEFAEFIIKLLGKPETIKYSRTGVFNVTRENLIDLHYLLRHRVSEQNEGALVEFQARIELGNGMSRTIRDFDQFVSYRETINSITKRVILSWIFIIKFNDRRNAERQQVEISFEINKKLDSDSFSKFSLGTGSVRVLYTARSWGDDIHSLITNRLEDLIRMPAKVQVFLKRHEPLLCTLITSILLVSVSYLFYQKFRSESLSKLKNIESGFEGLIEPDSLVAMIRAVLHSLYDYEQFLPIAIILVFLVPSTILLLIFVKFTLEAINVAKPSFLIMSPNDISHREQSLKKYKNRLIILVVTLAGSLLLGIIGNVVAFYIIQGYLT